MKTPQQKIEKYEAKIAELKIKIENENKQQSPKDFFLQIFNGATVKIDLEKYPNSIFYFSGDTFLMEIEKQDEKIIAWVNYNKIWIPISEQHASNYSQTQEFFKLTIEDHFKLREVTVIDAHEPIGTAIEDHFKLREVTVKKK